MVRVEANKKPERLLAARIERLDPGIAEDRNFTTQLEDLLPEILPLWQASREEASC